MHTHFCKTFIIINCLCRSAQLPKTELSPVTTASDSIAGESSVCLAKYNIMMPL